jgi:GDP-L-fucose synthase
MASACLRLMTLPDDSFDALLARERNDGLAPLVNIGTGHDVTIAELAALVKAAVGYRGEIVFDPTKPDGTPRKLMDASRLGNLGWAPTVSLDLGIRSAYSDYQASIGGRGAAT